MKIKTLFSIRLLLLLTLAFSALVALTGMSQWRMQLIKSKLALFI